MLRIPQDDKEKITHYHGEEHEVRHEPLFHMIDAGLACHGTIGKMFNAI